LSGGFSLLVANLTRGALFCWNSYLISSASSKRMEQLILSGLLQEQSQEVMKPLRLLAFKEIQVVTASEWACITARKKE